MKIRLHKQARTTPAIRQEIRESDLSERALAAKYGISRSTVRKWKQRQSVEDHSHRPHAIHTAFAPLDELFTVGLRKLLLLPLDDLLLVLTVFLSSSISRSALDRCLRRHGSSKLADLLDHDRHRQGKTHNTGIMDITSIDLSPLLRAPLYLAVDRATRWIYAEIRPAHTAATFLQNLLGHAPFQITAVHSNTSSQFTANPPHTVGKAIEADFHPFPQLCRQHHLSHHLHDVDRASFVSEDFAGLLAAYHQQGLCWPLNEARQVLEDFCSFFNAELPLKCLGHRTPLATIQGWQGNAPPATVDEMPLPTTRDQSPYQHSHHRSPEEEELFQLLHANRHLRLQQALLARSQKVSSSKTTWHETL